MKLLAALLGLTLCIPAYGLSVEMRQLYPNGQVTSLGKRDIDIPGIEDAIPGVEKMQCVLVVRDWTGWDKGGQPTGIPNGIFESPGIMFCPGPGYTWHVLIELPYMENKHLET